MAQVIPFDPRMATPAAEKPEEPILPIREDLDLYPGTPTSEGIKTWVIHDRIRNRFYNIGWLEYEILKRWSYRYPSAIQASIHNETTLSVDIQEITYLNEYLVLNELSKIDSERQREQLTDRVKARKKKLKGFFVHRYLFLRIPIMKPDRFLANTIWLVKPFFTKTFRRLIVLLALVTFALVARQWTDYVNSWSSILTWKGLAYLFVALFFSKTLHEFGHAYVCKYYGLRVPVMGVAIMVFWPFLYTDTSESWKLSSRRKRIIIGSAGVLTELYIAVVGTFLWCVLPESSIRSALFFVSTTSWIATLVVNISPFLRWDGYYVLSDLLGVQNLQQRGFKYGVWRLRELLFAWGVEPPEHFNTRRRKLILGYAYGTWVYRIFLFMGIAFLVYTYVFKALGVILMVSSMAFFLVRPIVKEVKEWYTRRELMKWNFHSITTLAVFICTVCFFVLPWQHSVAVSAVVMPERHKTIYSPVPARIEKVDVTLNQTVTEGQPFITLASKDLMHEARIAEHQVASFQATLDRFVDQESMESKDTVQQDLESALSRLKGIRSQLSQLEIEAPFSGEIVALDETIATGRWVKNDTPLAVVADKSSLELHAYVLEHDLSRVSLRDKAVFYPENPLLDPVTVVVKEIDKANTNRLEDEILSTSHGGGVETLDDPRYLMRPMRSLYRVRLEIDDPEAAAFTLVTRGTVHLAGENRSLVSRAWRSATATVIRESGF